MLVFGLRDDGMEEPARFLGNMKLGTDDDGGNKNSKSSCEKWKVMKFDHPHEIKTDLEEEQKALLATNNEFINQRLLFGEEKTFSTFSLDLTRILYCSISESQSWRQSVQPWYCEMILSLQKKLTILYGCRKIQHQRVSGLVRKLPSES